MRSKTPIIVGSVAFAALAGVAVPRHVRSIEQDLRARAQQSLATAGNAARVEVSGRDLLLSGELADENERRAASAAVASLWGVRCVVDRMQVAIAAAPAPPTATTRRIGAAVLPTPRAAAPPLRSTSMRVTAQLAADGAVTLTGQAPSETARAAIVGRAQEIYSAARVRDRLRAVEEEEMPGWRAAVLEGLTALRRLERGRMDATPYRIRVGGVAVDGKLEDEIAAALRSVAPQGFQVAVDVDAPPRDSGGGAGVEG